MSFAGFALPLLLPLAMVLAPGCSSREQRARELIERKRLVETLRTNPATAMMIPEGQEPAFVKACVRAVVREFSEEELSDALRFARTALGAKETSFQIEIIQTSLQGAYPPEAQLDPGRLNLARTLVADDPAAAKLARKVTDGIARSAAKTFAEDELKLLLARARDPRARSVQEKWPRLVAAALHEMAAAAASQDPPTHSP